MLPATKSKSAAESSGSSCARLHARATCRRRREARQKSWNGRQRDRSNSGAGGAAVDPGVNELAQHLRRAARDGTFSEQATLSDGFIQWEIQSMGRYLLLWLLGVPIPILILIWAFGGLH